MKVLNSYAHMFVFLLTLKWTLHKSVDTILYIPINLKAHRPGGQTKGTLCTDHGHEAGILSPLDHLDHLDYNLREDLVCCQRKVRAVC